MTSGACRSFMEGIILYEISKSNSLKVKSDMADNEQLS